MARKIGSGAQLILATHNPGKLREIAALVRPFGVALVSARALGLAEPAENATDFIGNARIKALVAARASRVVALADDSGFCVAGLGGEPGVHSARWAGSARDFGAAMARVHDLLNDATDRRAWFISALCLAWPDGHTETFVGRVDGVTVWPPRGDKGFGYDPIFVPTGESETFGEMAPERKDAISHRARAFAQLAAACLSLPTSSQTHAPGAHASAGTPMSEALPSPPPDTEAEAADAAASGPGRTPN